MERVTISRDAWDAMVRHAVAARPLECCGLLVGQGRSVATAVPAKNARESATRFLVDPVDHFAAIRLARGQGLDVIGAYHSHPSAAPEPSPTDVDEAADPSLIHVIVSLRAGTPELAAYHIRDRAVVRLEAVREA